MMARAPRCTAWTGAHHFEARFDSEMPVGFNSSGYKGSGLAYLEMLKLMRKNTYVRDVCVKCGVTVERATPCAA